MSFIELIADLQPNQGCTTDEPSLREIVRKYYAPHFDEETTERLTASYFVKLAEILTVADKE